MNIFGTFRKVSFLSVLAVLILKFGTPCFWFVNVISISVRTDDLFINHEYPPLPLYLPCNMCVYVHVCMYIDVRYAGVCMCVCICVCVHICAFIYCIDCFFSFMWAFLTPQLFGVCLDDRCFMVIILNNKPHVILWHELLIILHIAIWYINGNFTQSLLLSFGTSNKLDLLVYLLRNMLQTCVSINLCPVLVKATQSLNDWFGRNHILSNTCSWWKLVS